MSLRRIAHLHDGQIVILRANTKLESGAVLEQYYWKNQVKVIVTDADIKSISNEPVIEDTDDGF